MKKYPFLNHLLPFCLVLALTLGAISCGNDSEKEDSEKTDEKTGEKTTAQGGNDTDSSEKDSKKESDVWADSDDSDEDADPFADLLDGDLFKILAEYEKILENLESGEENPDNFAQALLGIAQKVALPAMNLFLDKLMEEGWQEEARDAFHEGMQEEFDILSDDFRGEKIALILEKIIAANKLDGSFKIFLIDGEDPNAFAIVGGYLYMTNSMFDEMKDDESQLACIIGHEVAHVTLKHCEEKAKLLAFAGQFGDFPAMAANIGLWLSAPFSQNDEYEADEKGARFAEKAGYDPKAAAKALKKALGGTDEGDDFDELFESHPYPSKRIKRLEEIFE